VRLVGQHEAGVVRLKDHFGRGVSADGHQAPG
jgi:hypothetical protein